MRGTREHEGDNGGTCPRTLGGDGQGLPLKGEVHCPPCPTGHLVLHEKKKGREMTGRHDDLAEGVPAAEGWRYVQAADPAAVEALEDTLKRALKPEGSVHGSAAD